MRKFGRNYRLAIQGQSRDTIVIEPPFSVEFDIQRNILSSANVANIKIYNLSENVRNELRKDKMDYADPRLVTFYCGYGEDLSIVLAGFITQGFSERTGSDMITTIKAFDGGYAFANAQISREFPRGTSNRVMIENLVGQLDKFGVTKGAIGDYPGKIERGASFTGGLTSRLAEITGGGFFIDNNVAHCLGENECLKSEETMIINSESGLLGTPMLEEATLTFDMIFEPKLFIGQKIFLESSTASYFTGFYKIIAVNHSGMISDSVSGAARTKATMFYGSAALREVVVG